MFALIWTLSVCLLPSVLSCSVLEGPVNITAEPGQTVNLTCQVPRNKTVTLVEWKKHDLEPDYVFLYRSRESDPDEQHPSFKNRVELKDKNMTDGDVSVIVKNVTINDTGTYECYVAEKGNRPELIITINLTVRDSGRGAGQSEDKNGHVGLAVCLPFVFLLLLVVAAVVGFMIYRNNKTPSDQNSYKPPAEQAGETQM